MRRRSHDVGDLPRRRRPQHGERRAREKPALAIRSGSVIEKVATGLNVYRQRHASAPDWRRIAAVGWGVLFGDHANGTPIIPHLLWGTPRELIHYFFEYKGQ
jgi:hypothetical protein